MSNNKLHGHPLSVAFIGDSAGGYFFNEGRSDNTYAGGSFSVNVIQNANAIQNIIVGEAKEIVWQYTPTGVVAGSATNNPYHGPISKPPTVAFMWICRYC